MMRLNANRGLVALAASCTLVLAVSAPTALSAQAWRSFYVARQLRDSGAVAVHVAFGAGRVALRPAEGRSLFDVHLRYDAERAEPLYRFDAQERRLDVGVRHFSNTRAARGYKGSELQIALARGVPIELDLDIGAAEGDIDLSGLRLQGLAMKGGATETRVRFGVPNPERLSAMRIDAGAASVTVDGLGNANVERIDANIGVGNLELDFGGTWRGDVHLSVTSALGKVELTVPSAVGVRVEKTSFLHSFTASGLEKQNGYWISENWDTATHKLYIRATGTLGSLEITRGGR